MMNAYLFYTPVKRRIKSVWIIHVDSYYLRIHTTIIDIIIIAVQLYNKVRSFKRDGNRDLISILCIKVMIFI